MITDEVLDHLQALSDAGDRAPWEAVVEGRDQEGGSSFIQVSSGATRGTDIYVQRERVDADAPLLDLIAAARNYLPLLIAEIRELRAREH